MLLLQRPPQQSMEQDYANGLNPSPYDSDRQRRAWDSNQVPFSTSYVPDATTQLPPIQTGRNAYEPIPSSNAYDPIRRPQPLPNTSLAQPYSPYSAQTPQSPYGHAVSHFQHNAHLFSQNAQQISPITQQFPASTYSPIRPMPPALASGQAHPLSAGFAPSANYGFPPSTADDHPDSPQRLQHVVGSQGRRGVLPSDEGRPQAIASTMPGPKSTVIPQKDADGKFPCPHCNKTYLHGKHLKRHLLRHTGDRPYSCFLCADTFSRSDILKRHFQKCSQRRGNPTGASHLAFSQTHMKRQAAREKASAAQAANARREAQNNGTMVDVNGSAGNQATMNASAVIYDSNVGMGALHADQHHLADISTKPYADMRDARSGATGPSPGLSRSQHQNYLGQASSTSLPSSGDSTPLTAKTPGGHFPQQTFMTESQRGMYSDMSPRNNQNNNNNHLVAGSAPFDSTNAFEWSSFSAHGKDSSGSVPSVFASAGQPSPTYHQNIDPDSQQGHFKTTIPQLEDSREEDASTLAVLPVSQAKSERLIAFCQLDHSVHHEELRSALAPEKIDHFIQQYYHHFYQHFPIIHIPTFDPETTYDGLLLAIICTGAVYSDQLEIKQVRELARKTAIALKNSSSWFNNPSVVDVSDTVRMDELADELHAFVSISSLSLWHGDDLQKLQAMKDWQNCITMTLRLGLNQVASELHPNFSFFHQPGFVEDSNRHEFSFFAWLWQEKRNRLMFTIFLTDAVMAFFFNQIPKLDPLQLRIPLPSDDAAWDASDEESCATALGFYGLNHQQALNVSGSLRKKQPEMHLALAALETLGKELAPRTTNAASKFLLIHGLLVHLCTVQKSSTLAPRDFPILESDWIVESMHDPTKPIDPSPLSMVEAAADKWIKAWDRDMPSQYPPGVKRVGYSRDGVHYYWLAKLLIQNSDTVNVHSLWSERLQQILKILKYIKTWVSGNQLVRGEGTGSVSLLDERYGLEDLSKDMKLLLAPLGT